MQHRFQSVKHQRSWKIYFVILSAQDDSFYKQVIVACSKIKKNFFFLSSAVSLSFLLVHNDFMQITSTAFHISWECLIGHNCKHLCGYWLSVYSFSRLCLGFTLNILMEIRFQDWVFCFIWVHCCCWHTFLFL